MPISVYYFYRDKVNIIEAIAKAGDLTVYGNRLRVMLIRKTETGDKVKMVDLTDRNLLNQEEYYILPNDIIYIEPNKASKSLGFGTSMDYRCQPFQLWQLFMLYLKNKKDI